MVAWKADMRLETLYSNKIEVHRTELEWFGVAKVDPIETAARPELAKASVEIIVSKHVPSVLAFFALAGRLPDIQYTFGNATAAFKLN